MNFTNLIFEFAIIIKIMMKFEIEIKQKGTIKDFL